MRHGVQSFGSPGAARSARRDGRRTNAGRRRPWPSPNFSHPTSDGPHFGFREQWRRSGIDSQSVKRTPESYVESGCDGGQLVTGRKRPVVVDTIGCVLVVRVHAANVFDGKAARQVITNLFSSLHTVKKIRGDRAYSGADLFNWVLTPFECQREVVRKKKGQRGFYVLPRRWVVERTFAWLSRWRRLSKDI